MKVFLYVLEKVKLSFITKINSNFFYYNIIRNSKLEQPSLLTASVTPVEDQIKPRLSTASTACRVFSLLRKSVSPPTLKKIEAEIEALELTQQ